MFTAKGVLMKKFLSLMVFVAASSYAALQYEIVSSSNGVQNWTGSQQLTLNITEGGSLWFSSFVSNWYSMADLGDVARMTAGNYGAVVNGTTVVAGTGEATTVTFTGQQGNKPKEVSGIGYFVGDFEAGDQLSFWVTSSPGVAGSSMGLVSDVNGQLQSRQINQTDLAGNTRINFGFSGFGSVEFVASGGAYKNGQGPVGQPLPGAFAALLLGGGAMGGLTFSRRKRG